MEPQRALDLRPVLCDATPEQKRAFEQAVRDGCIGVDAMYGNLLTGVSRAARNWSTSSPRSKELGRRCGVNVDSMMISDVPGLTWGLIPALTQAGVKYISDGPNYVERIGSGRESRAEDRPFYWVAAQRQGQGALLGRSTSATPSAIPWTNCRTPSPRRT